MKSLSPSADPLESWHLSPAANKEYDFVDGLRGVAILLVLGCHLIYVNPAAGAWTQFIGSLFGAGAAGVPLFFAISGFLISWPFWRRKARGERNLTPPGYAQRRFFKIYPPFALSVLVLAVLNFHRFGDASCFPLAAEWLVGAPLLFPVPARLNPVVWSLVVEVQFYITLPIVMLATRRISARTCLWLLPVLFFAVGFGRRLIDYGLSGAKPVQFEVLNFPFPSSLDVFALGLFVAGLHSLGFLRPRHVLLGYLGIGLYALTLFALAWLHATSWSDGPGREIFALAVEISTGLILFLVADPRAAVPRALGHPALRWCGIVSYEWYLFHQQLIFRAREIVGPTCGNVLKYLALIGGSFALTLLLAAFVYRFFSLPILRFGRDRAPRPA